MKSPPKRVKRESIQDLVQYQMVYVIGVPDGEKLGRIYREMIDLRFSKYNERWQIANSGSS